MDNIKPDLPSGFFGSLFDLSFTNFITSKIIKLLYILSIAIAAIVALSVVASGFAASTTVGIFSLLIVAPLVFLLGVIYARVLLEIIIVTFRISEHASQIAANVEKATSSIPDQDNTISGEGYDDSLE